MKEKLLKYFAKSERLSILKRLKSDCISIVLEKKNIKSRVLHHNDLYFIVVL